MKVITRKLKHLALFLIACAIYSPGVAYFAAGMSFSGAVLAGGMGDLPVSVVLLCVVGVLTHIGRSRMNRVIEVVCVLTTSED